MRLRLGLRPLLVACLLLTLVVSRAPAGEVSAEARPVTPEQGEAIVKTARRHKQRKVGRKSDCSHLVHEVYTLAGYPYPYASSLELYAGIPDFMRVRKPQVGDLVVWRGHVGIVVDSEQHTFYSSLRSGLHTDDYDLPHWKARGHARFYRYVTDKPAETLVAAHRPDTNRPAPDAAKAVQVASASSVGDDDYADATATPTALTSASGAAAGSSSQSPATLSSGVLIPALQERPTEAEIVDAISELNNAAGSLLRENDLAQVRRKVIIYDELALARAKLGAKRGEAQMQIDFRVAVAGKQIERKRQHQWPRWELQRTDNGWEVLAPTDRVYVPRDVAIRMLSARLASLTQKPAAHEEASVRQQAQIVHLLSALLDESR
jgi:hypothetical protein